MNTEKSTTAIIGTAPVTLPSTSLLVGKADSIYKKGYKQSSSTFRVDRTKSQRLSPSKLQLIEATVAALTNSMQTLCPITGLLSSTDFPAKPGFYMDAYHPIVHNCKAMLKDSSYTSLLSQEQKVGLILASLHFYGVLSLEAPAIVVNLALQGSLSNNQLDLFLSFLRESLAITNKTYPIISLDASSSETTLIGYMHKCDEIEHTNYETVSLDDLCSADKATTNKKFTVPKFMKSERRAIVMDKEAYDLYLDCMAYLPQSLIDKAKPFIKTLVTNPSHSMIEKLLSAINAKWTTIDSAQDGEAELAIYELTAYVKSSRESAAKLGIYPDLENILFSAQAYAPAPISSLEETAGADAGRVEEPMSPFAARLAAIKNKGLVR